VCTSEYNSEPPILKGAQKLRSTELSCIAPIKPHPPAALSLRDCGTWHQSCAPPEGPPGWWWSLFEGRKGERNEVWKRWSKVEAWTNQLFISTIVENSTIVNKFLDFNNDLLFFFLLLPLIPLPLSRTHSKAHPLILISLTFTLNFHSLELTSNDAPSKIARPWHPSTKLCNDSGPMPSSSQFSKWNWGCSTCNWLVGRLVF